MDGASVGAQVMIHNTHPSTMQDEWYVEKRNNLFFCHTPIMVGYN